jgi:hypothetical protein
MPHDKLTNCEAYRAPSTIAFAILSAAYLTSVALGAWLLGYFDPKGAPIGPSEWGDVLAGIFSPLAFLWLVYTALAQRAELSLQRHELQQNNVTQEEQQQQMQRQADVMAAQAHAQFEPILVCKRIDGSRTDSFVVAHLSNEGAAALNVIPAGASGSALSELRIGLQRPGTRIAEPVLAHFPGGSTLLLRIPMPSDLTALIEVELKMSRLDLQTFNYVYLLHMDSRRLELLRRNSPISGRATMSFGANGKLSARTAE